MRSVNHYRIRTALASAAVLTGITLWAAPAAGAPPRYVSCPGGYIATNLRDCPQLPIRRPPEPARGGGGGGGGLLGGLLGGLGL